MGKYILLSFLLHAGAFGFILVWSGGSLPKNIQEFFGREIDDDSEYLTESPEELSEEVLEKSLEKNNEDILKTPVQNRNTKARQKPSNKKEKIEKKKAKNKTKTVASGGNNKKRVKFQEKVEKEKKSSTPEAVSQKNYEVVYNSEVGENEEKLESELALLKEEGAENNLVKFQEKQPSDNEKEASKESLGVIPQDEQMDEASDLKEKKEVPQEFQDIENFSPELGQKLKNSQELSSLPGNPLPIYPEEARANKYEGSVFLLYFVDAAGLVDKIQLLKSSGHSLLDNEALRVMARQKYESGQEGWYKHQIDFKLEDTKTF